MTIDLTAELSRGANPLPWKPSFFDLSKEGDRHAMRGLFARGEARFIVDDFDEQLREYHACLNPALVFSPGLEEAYQAYRAEFLAGGPLWRRGIWVFYPWRGTLVHVLEAAPFQRVRTSRNRDLIPEDEQRRFADAVVGIAGLSVGNSVALATVLQGGADRIRLADFDRLALSNLNRVRAGVADLGSNKAEVTARQIYELNPYAQVEIFAAGLTEENIPAFFGGPPKLDIVVDEIDNIAVKYLIREHARQSNIPVLMATDNGDDGVMDIERYDLDPGTPIFHGRMGDVSYEKLKNLDKMGIGRLAVKYIGPELTPRRLRSSMLQIGRTIVSWPQLGGAALLNGSIAAYCIRNIAAGLPLVSDRAVFKLDEKLAPRRDAGERKEQEARDVREFAKMLGL